jgi:hypothetical protein
MWNCWKASSIEEIPELELAAWKIYEVSSPLWEGRTRHFSGYNLTEMEGRASNVIVDFDYDAFVGITKSGRKYRLVGNRVTMGEQGDADYVWTYYVASNQLFDVVDVSAEYKCKSE